MRIKFSEKINKITFFYLIISFAINFLRFMSIPFLMIYLSNRLTISVASIGFIIGIPSAIQLLIGLFAANVIDRISFKWGTIFSLLFPMLGILGYIIFTNFYMLILSATISGIGWSIYNPIIMTALSNTTKTEYIDSVMNINYWATNLGGVLGPIVGVFIGAGNTPTPFIIFSVILLLISIVAYIIVPHDLKPKIDSKKTSPFHDFLTIVKDRRAVLLFLAFFCIFFIEVQYETSFSLYLKNLFGSTGVKLVAAMLSIMTFTIIIVQPFITLISKKVKTPLLLCIGVFFYIGATCLFFFSKITFLIFVSAVLFALGEIFIAPKLQGITAKIAPPYLQTTYFSFVTMGGNLAYFLGPPVGNFLLTANSFYLFTFILIMISTLLFSSFFSVKNLEQSLNK
ncbi:MFS transporter [Listeria aquatica]|uniref:MFS transporter n=1 Tax=Listeria aquatica TaxID=1494960 RepID=UPI0031F4F647